MDLLILAGSGREVATIICWEGGCNYYLLGGRLQLLSAGREVATIICWEAGCNYYLAKKLSLCFSCKNFHLILYFEFYLSLHYSMYETISFMLNLW